MEEEFCTLFDSTYLPRALVLHRSLTEHCERFRLRCLCMDEPAERALRALALPELEVIPLRELEAHDRELARVKADRSHAEYCWTAASALCAFVFDHEPSVELITYLDADMEFFASPETLFRELGDGSVMLSPHQYAPEFKAKQRTGAPYDEPGGQFNVQFTTFRRDESGLAALAWWRERCIERCRDRYEPGRYAGQKYLDELPSRFAGVRVAKHVGAGVAPWNISQYRLEQRNGQLLVDGTPLIYHHFQSLEVHPATPAARRVARSTSAYRLTEGPIPLVWTTGWRLNERELSMLWDPYMARLSQACRDVMDATGADQPPMPRLKPRRAAFHVIRRRVPGAVRKAYWHTRAAVWMRRGELAGVERLSGD
jgi:hypothetical protein